MKYTQQDIDKLLIKKEEENFSLRKQIESLTLLLKIERDKNKLLEDILNHEV